MQIWVSARAAPLDSRKPRHILVFPLFPEHGDEHIGYLGLDGRRRQRQQGGNASLLPALIEHPNQYPGGLSGLIASFQKGGLGEIVSSWVGKGENLPVSADQLGSVLDPGVVQSLADKTGQDASSVLGSLSTMLPQLVDKATPDGTAQPGQSFNPTDLLASLSGLPGNRG